MKKDFVILWLSVGAAAAIMFATVALADSPINLWPSTQAEAQQQLSDTVDRSREQNEYYLEKRRQEESIDALHDIEDAIIFNSLEEGDD